MKFFKLTALAVCIIIYIMACKHEASHDKAEEIQIRATDQKKFEPEKFSNEKENDFKSDTIQQTPKQSPIAAAASQNNIDWNKKIIKTAFLNVETKDFKIFDQSIREKVKQAGGYIAQEEQSQSDYKIENVLTIKVPVQQFENTVLQLTNGIEKLIEKKITSEDVTAEVIDIKSRMEAKRQVRLRYLDLLKQAKNMEEILNVQSEINTIQEDIESAAGRVEFLNHSSAYSTVHLTFFQVINASAKDIDEPSFTQKIWQSFRIGWVWLGNICIALISVWPLILAIFAGWALFKRWTIKKAKPV